MNLLAVTFGLDRLGARFADDPIDCAELAGQPFTLEPMSGITAWSGARRRPLQDG